ncbi:MAG: ABC transporter permease [Desulfobacterales bacterium]
MLINDSAKLAIHALSSQRMRSFLTALGIAVGIASVVLLTSIGEGIHKFVLSEFTQFGTNLIAVTPGRTTTAGMSGAVISNVRPLSIDDALALRRISKILGVVPFVQGNASAEFRKRGRRTYVFGVGPEAPDVWKMKVAMGRFLPDDDPRASRAFAVLGDKVKKELFNATNPLGRRIRIGGRRFRVIGVMESKGQMLGFARLRPGQWIKCLTRKPVARRRG